MLRLARRQSSFTVLERRGPLLVGTLSQKGENTKEAKKEGDRTRYQQEPYQ